MLRVHGHRQHREPDARFEASTKATGTDLHLSEEQAEYNREDLALSVAGSNAKVKRADRILGGNMGVWALPFNDKKKAKKLRQKMSRPWMAKVRFDSEADSYRWQADGLSFGEESVFGSDDLWDYLSEVAGKKRGDFDIRKYVKECLMYQVWHVENQIQTLYDVKAFNDVRVALALKPVGKVREYNRCGNTYLAMQKLLAESGILVEAVEIVSQIKGLAWTTGNYFLLPESFQRKSINLAICNLKSGGNPKQILQSLKFVNSVDVEKSRGGETRVTILFSSASPSELRHLGRPSPKKNIKMALKKGKSDKYWEANVVGTELRVQFGRAGASPRKNAKKFKSNAAAIGEMQLRIEEKTKKGYSIVGS